MKEKIREFILSWTKLDSDSLTYDSPLVEHRLIDSMGLMRVVAYLENEFELIIEPEDIRPHDFTNIESIALLVERLQASKSPDTSSNGEPAHDAAPAGELGIEPSRATPREGTIPTLDVGAAGNPVSPQQEAICFLHETDPSSRALHARVWLWIEGRLDAGALRAALSSLLERHELLRSKFARREGRWVQQLGAPAPVELRSFDLASLSAEQQQVECSRLVDGELSDLFDLDRVPLMRFALVRLGEEHHALLQVAHALVHDARSAHVLLTDLAALYAHHAHGAPPPPPIARGFSELATIHRRWLESSDSAAHLAYWKKALAGAPALLGLPADHPRPSRDDLRGASPQQLLPRALWERVVALAESRHTTPLAVALAAFDVVLHRYSDQRDLAVGVAFANRRWPGSEAVVGPFLNPCAVRTRVEAEEPFSALLERTHRAVREAEEHQEVPFSRVVEAVRPHRSHPANPLFQVMFGIREVSPRANVEGLRFRLGEGAIASTTSKLDLDVSIIAEEEVTVVWEHRSSLFEPETIAGMMIAYRRTLEQIVADPEIVISRIDLLDAPARRRLTEIGVRPADANALQGSLIGQLLARAEEKPDATASISSGRAWTYRELTENVSRIAHHLRAVGIDEDTVVGVCLDRSNALLAAQLGVLAARGAYLPLDPAYPADRIEYMIQDSGARVVLTERKHASLVPSGVEAIDVFRCLEQAAPRTLMIANPSSLAYILYTSGSTGRPKGVAVRHQALVNFLHSVAEAPGFDTRRRMLAVTTSCFDISGLELYLPLWLGGVVEIASSDEARNGVALRQRLDSGEIGAMQATPATWQILRLASWKNQKRVAVLVGGEALDPELARYHSGNGAQVWNLYGPTETTIWSALLRVDDDSVDPARVHGSVPVGHPFANTSLYVLDRELEPRPLGIIGDVYIAGSGLAAGYVGKPSMTASKMVPDASGVGARMYYTGDLGRWRHEGRLEIAGRRDNQIKLHGFRIELGEIESALSALPGVAETAVVATQGPNGPLLVGFVTAKDGAALETEPMIAALRKNLPAHMVPAHLEVMAEFPRTANGKTDRKVLTAWKKSGRARADGGVLEGHLEQTLGALWAEHLGVEHVGPNEDYFQLGGHSIGLIELLHQIESRVGQRLSLRALLEHPTVRELARYLQERKIELKKAEPAVDPIRALLAKASPEERAVLERLLAKEQ